MAEILTAEDLFVTDNSACLARQVETGDISNEEEEALLSEKTEISEVTNYSVGHKSVQRRHFPQRIYR